MGNHERGPGASLPLPGHQNDQLLPSFAAVGAALMTSIYKVDSRSVTSIGMGLRYDSLASNDHGL